MFCKGGTGKGEWVVVQGYFESQLGRTDSKCHEDRLKRGIQTGRKSCLCRWYEPTFCAALNKSDGFPHSMLHRSHPCRGSASFPCLPISSWIKPKSIYLLLTDWNAISVLTSSSVQCRMKPGTSFQQLLSQHMSFLGPAEQTCWSRITSCFNMSSQRLPLQIIEALFISKAVANPEVQIICVVHRATGHLKHTVV